MEWGQEHNLQYEAGSNLCHWRGKDNIQSHPAEPVSFVYRVTGSGLGTENMEVKRQPSSCPPDFPSEEPMDLRGGSFEDWEILERVEIGLE